MNTVVKILIAVAILVLIASAVLVWLGVEPLTSATKDLIANVVSFNWQAIPQSVYALGLGFVSAIGGAWKVVSDKIKAYKTQTVKAQTEYQDLQGQATQVVRENQTLQQTVAAKDEAITGLNNQVEQGKEAIQAVTKEKEQALTQVEKTRREMEVLYKQNAANFQSAIPSNTVVIGPDGTKIIKVIETVVK